MQRGNCRIDEMAMIYGILHDGESVGVYQDIALTNPATIKTNGRERTVLLSVQELAWRLSRSCRLKPGNIRIESSRTKGSRCFRSVPWLGTRHSSGRESKTSVGTICGTPWPRGMCAGSALVRVAGDDGLGDGENGAAFRASGRGASRGLRLWR